MFVTLEVSKVLTSIFVKDSHESNIFLIFVTREVLNFEVAIDFNFLHLLNIYSIFSTIDVSKLSGLYSILIRL